MNIYRQSDLFDEAEPVATLPPPNQPLHAVAAASAASASLAGLAANVTAAGQKLAEVMARFDEVYNLSTAEKVARARGAIHRMFDAGHPCSIGFSAGKDSSVLMDLVFEVVVERKGQGLPLTPILITHARTGVDNPAYEQVALGELDKIRAFIAAHELPARVDVSTPALNDTWAVRIISGRALPTFANSASRDCAINLKLLSQQRQRKAALKELSVAGEPVVLTGVRFDESDSRFDRMLHRHERDDDIWLQEVRTSAGKKVKHELRLSPICFFSQEDVWVRLSELMSGSRKSYTDAAAIWEAYRDGGNTSCAVVSDDVMKANAKACGARFGCWSCSSVGRDKSLEAMLESDPKYAYMLGLNRLQRFIVDTQYDMSRRQWVGRTITDDGYIAVAPDAYSPEMQRDLLRYSLTLDRDEQRAARRLGIEPRFEVVSHEQLIAIDIIWSMQGHQPRPFEAIHIWSEVYEQGKSFYPPEVQVVPAADRKVPKAKWLYVGRDYDSDAGYSDFYSGGRNLMADLTGATETCVRNRTTGKGRVVLDVRTSPMFEVDAEGAELFMAFEVMDSRVHERKAAWDPGEAYRHYSLLGTFSTSSQHVTEQDYMLRRAAWKQRHGVYQMTTTDLLAHSVDDAQRAAGMRAPAGVQSLPEKLSAKLEAEHARRTATRWRAPAEVAA